MATASIPRVRPPQPRAAGGGVGSVPYAVLAGRRVPVATTQGWVSLEEYNSRLADLAALEAQIGELEAERDELRARLIAAGSAAP